MRALFRRVSRVNVPRVVLSRGATEPNRRKLLPFWLTIAATISSFSLASDPLRHLRWQLEAIYMRFAPHKLGKVDRLLVKYVGDEDKLLRIVRRKYVDTGEAEKTWYIVRYNVLLFVEE